MGLPERPERSGPELRVGDRERQLVVDHLRTSLADGRLSLDEFEERTGLALAARTSQELVVLTADLPALPRPGPKGPPIRPRAPKPPQPPADGWDIAWRIHCRVWGILSVFFVVVWLLTGTGDFWPVWPILGVGVTVGVHGAVRRAVRG